MTASAHPPVPIAERPLSTLEIADGALAILRKRPRTVAAIAAAIVLPSQLLATWLSRDVLSQFTLDNFDSETGQFGGSSSGPGFGFFGGPPIATFLQYAVLPFLGVALTYLALGWRQGEDRSAGQCLLFTVKKAHIILIAFVLSKIVQIVTLLLTTPMIMLVAPVIAAEGLGPIAAIKRAFVLGRRRYWPLIGLLLLLALINVLLTYAMLLLPLGASFLLGDWGWIAYFALGSVGNTVLNILGAGAAALAYIDVTNRTEGADITRRLNTVRSNG